MAGATGEPDSILRVSVEACGKFCPHDLTFTATQSRRDRGKIAQRNFRKREADKVSDLKKTHERLRRLVQEVVLASRDDDQTALNHAIAEAGRAIGLEENDSSDSKSRSLSQEHGTSTAFVSNAVTFEIPEKLFDGDPRRPPICHNRSGRMSPRFDYGIWIDPERFFKILEPSADIRPYVGTRRHTVAGHITWATLDYGYACLREAIMFQMGRDIDIEELPESLPPGSAARRLFDVSVRHTKQLHDIAYIMDLVEARLEFDKLGYMRSNTRGADEPSRQVLEGQVLGGLRARGVRLDQWLSALDIEAHIRHQMGILEFSAFQTALSQKQSIQTQLLMPLARTLAHRGVCFGDGPRWNVTYVTALVHAWVSHISNMGV
ncbi:hypothetical protein H2200_012207 [Cladophialophora chaetospira]|uniref:Uncharacterized protein n=1 Tax=Cladophialophora chaetospira TaxID=386627 RepID=A0AA38WYF3_9EURO|nr:hypothetical protein H2200_012207 [Cladophialophora chaetospira]